MKRVAPSSSDNYFGIEMPEDLSFAEEPGFWDLSEGEKMKKFPASWSASDQYRGILVLAGAKSKYQRACEMFEKMAEERGGSPDRGPDQGNEPLDPATVEDGFTLRSSNPAPRDGDLYMIEETHTYMCKGKKVRMSATGVGKKYFPGFDGDAIVKKFYDNWKVDKSGKYKMLIDYLKNIEHKDDDFCKQAIVKTWQSNGNQASGDGTDMHKDFQYIVEGVTPPQGNTNEVTQFRKWLHDFCTKYHLKPWRAEWNIYYEAPDGEVVIAGQVDLVLKHVAKEEYWCVDYKRKDPQPKRAGGPRVILGEEKLNKFTEMGTGPLSTIPATDFGKYSVQQNVYGHIAALQYGIDFRDRMYLLQVHPSLDEPHLVGVERLDDEMDAVFRIEMEAMKAEELS